MAAIAPDILAQIGPLPITNTLINTLMIDGLLVGGAYYLANHIKKVPGMFQNLMELVIGGFYSFTESISGKNAAKIFPWVFTFFIFILLSNWSGLLPGVGSVGFYEKAHEEVVAEKSVAPVNGEHAVSENAKPAESHAKESEAKAKKPHLIPLFRNATSDVNVTFALAIISVFATHVLSVRALGWKEYLGKFFSLNPIFLFVGMLEIISEFTKVVSLSFRLFGNIYAGEVVLATVNSLFAFLFPLPFITLEIIVGLVQAMVFAILTMVFMSILMTPHHAEESVGSKEVTQ